MSGDTDTTRIERVNYKRGERETGTLVLDADNMAVRATGTGGLVLELFRYGAKGDPLEGYQFRMSPEDTARLRLAASRIATASELT